MTQMTVISMLTVLILKVVSSVSVEVAIKEVVKYAQVCSVRTCVVIRLYIPTCRCT